MKLTVERAALVSALGFAASIVEARNTIPILSNIMLEATGESLDVVATDLDMLVRLSIPAVVEEAGAATVQAAKITSIAGAADTGAQIAIGSGNQDDGYGKLGVKFGRSRYSLQTLPATDFPILPMPEAQSDFTINAVELDQLLSGTRSTHSTAQTQYYLCGVHLAVALNVFGPQEGKDAIRELRAEAYDGARMLRVSMPIPTGVVDDLDIILSSKPVDAITRLLAKAEGNVRVEIAEGKMRISMPVRIGAELRDAVITTKLVEGQFPPVDRAVPKANDKSLLVNPALLKAAIARVILIAGEKTRAVKVELDKDIMKLSCNSPDHGLATEELPCVYDAPALTVGMNSAFLQSVIAPFVGDDLQIDLLNETAPVLFRTSGSNRTFGLLSPMRV